MGTAIALYIEREKTIGTQSSGHVYLPPNYVWNLDGEGGSTKEEVDIRYEGADPTRRELQPQNGATIGVLGQASVGRDACAQATLSTAPVRLQVGASLCVRTNRGRYSLLRIADLSDVLTMDFDTEESPTREAGNEVRLVDRDSYHFSRGQKGHVTGGDFYLIFDAGAAMFYANNKDQRGIVDLGDLRNVALAGIAPPTSGYYKFGVPVVAGHTYVSLAHAGEEGHYVIFRVDRVEGNAVTLSHAYR